MDAEALIARLKEFGVAVVVRDGRPSLRPPGDPEIAKLVKALMPAVAEHRDAVLAHFSPRTDLCLVCPTCSASWFLPAAEMAELLRSPAWCGEARCPLRRGS